MYFFVAGRKNIEYILTESGEKRRKIRQKDENWTIADTTEMGSRISAYVNALYAQKHAVRLFMDLADSF